MAQEHATKTKCHDNIFQFSASSHLFLLSRSMFGYCVAFNVTPGLALEPVGVMQHVGENVIKQKRSPLMGITVIMFEKMYKN